MSQIFTGIIYFVVIFAIGAVVAVILGAVWGLAQIGWDMFKQAISHFEKDGRAASIMLLALAIIIAALLIVFIR